MSRVTSEHDTRLLATSRLTSTPLRAADGDIGRCKDVLFDDQRWTVRYIVVDTGAWLPGRRVLIAPVSVGELEHEANRLWILLTRRQIEDAPALVEDAPVSRQHEMALHRHYGYTAWPGLGGWSLTPPPAGGLPLPAPGIADAAEGDGPRPPAASDGDPHLRSVDEVTGYVIHAHDGEIGQVDDFLIDATTWTVRYLVVDTGHWLPGRKVLLAPSWVTAHDWVNRSATVTLTTQQIEDSPEYRPEAGIDRDYETRLHDFYGRSAYWDVRGV